MRAWVQIAMTVLVLGATGRALAADAVLVTMPRGVPAKVGNQFVDAVKRGVAPAKIVKGPSLKVAKVSERVQALTKACAAKRTGFAIDAMVEAKKTLSVVAVAANGDVVYQKASPFPKPPAKQKAALADAAKAAAKAIKDAGGTAVAPPVVAEAPPPPPVETPVQSAPVEPSNNDAFSAGAAPPWMASSPSAGATPSLTTPSGSTSTSETPVVKETTKSRSGGGRGDFRIALGGAGGGAGYSEHIDSSRDQGDRDVKISMAPNYGGQLELEHAVGFRLNAMVLKQSATLKPDVTNPESISVDQLRIGGRVSWALTEGDVPIAIVAGGGYEKADTSTQTDVLWVPSSKLLTTFAGITVSSGDLTTPGFTLEGGAGIVPWGKHSRTSDTVKTDSRALGGQGWLRTRYQLPKAMGSSAGFFFELGGQLRYLTLSPGSVALPPDDGTLRTLSLPIGDTKSSRFDYGATLSIGIMWRPGD